MLDFWMPKILGEEGDSIELNSQVYYYRDSK